MFTYSSPVYILAVIICLELIKGCNQTEDIPIVSPAVDSLTSEECTADTTTVLDVDLKNIPTAFVTCVTDVEALKNKTHPDANKNTVNFHVEYFALMYMRWEANRFKYYLIKII